jgi:hypothetical protein
MEHQRRELVVEKARQTLAIVKEEQFMVVVETTSIHKMVCLILVLVAVVVHITLVVD